PPARRRPAALELANAEAARPFDLARGPLLRATLLALEGELHIALLPLHHTVADAWSLSILVRELGASYAAYASRAGRAAGSAPSPAPDPLPALAWQYA